MKTILKLLLPLLATSLAHAQDVNSTLAQSTHRQASKALLENPKLDHNPYAVLLKFAPEAASPQRTLVRTFAGVTTLQSYSLVPGLELVATNGLEPKEVVRTLKDLPGVEYAELDVVLRSAQNQLFPVDAIAANWGLHNFGQVINGRQATAGADVNAPEAWFVQTGDPNVTVAVIDGGVQWTHPGIDANIWRNPDEIEGNGIDDDGNGYVDDIRGWDFSAGDNDPMDEDGHGTHVAGTIGAEEASTGAAGVVGMMWYCKVVPLRFLNASGSGWMSDAALCIQYAVQKGVKVSNNSYGYGTGSVIQALYDAINAAKAANHLFVAAAGNGGSDGVGDNNDGNKKYYPASYDLDNIVSVAAIDMNDQLASFSNYGANNVDIAAPGVYILSTYLLEWTPGAWQRYLDGTSMAAPHVAGTLGLMFTEYPTWSYQQIKSRLIATARPTPAMNGKCVSGGVVDAGNALGNPAIAPPAPPLAPSAPTLTKSGSVVTIRWTDNSSNETEFNIQRETKSGNSWVSQTNLPNVAANTTSTTNSPGVGTHRYRVRASNEVGASAWSNWTQIKL